jgi:hypothetical protein
MQEETKAVIDAVAVGGTVGALAGWLPPLAALATIVFGLVFASGRWTPYKTYSKRKKHD